MGKMTKKLKPAKALGSWTRAERAWFKAQGIQKRKAATIRTLSIRYTTPRQSSVSVEKTPHGEGGRAKRKHRENRLFTMTEVKHLAARIADLQSALAWALDGMFTPYTDAERNGQRRAAKLLAGLTPERWD